MILLILTIINTSENFGNGETAKISKRKRRFGNKSKTPSPGIEMYRFLSSYSSLFGR